jgi:hypothetical protein
VALVQNPGNDFEAPISKQAMHSPSETIVHMIGIGIERAFTCLIENYISRQFAIHISAKVVSHFFPTYQETFAYLLFV